MGQIIITPSYVDLSNGSTWASLGGNQTAAKAAIQQVCTDIQNGTRTAGADVKPTVKVGLNAVPLSSGDTSGQALGGNLGSSNTFISNATKTLSAYKTLLLGLASPNSLQQTAWNGLPSSPPTVDGSTWNNIAFRIAVYAMFDFAGSGWFDNTVVGGVGIHSETGVDPNGLDSGASFYEIAFHEITESVLGRLASGITSTTVFPWDYYTYSASNTRAVAQATTRWLSQDSGTTNIANLSTSGDPGDFAALPNDAFNASGPNGPVSRSISLPLQQRDWQALALYLPMSTNGNTWGGMNNSSSAAFSPGLKR